MGKNKLIGAFLLGLVATTAKADVIQTELADLTVGTIGIETENAADIWGENPDADEVIRQINACAEISFNDKEREILRYILMADVGGVKTLEKRSEDYLNARLNTLMAQGMFRDVITLSDKVPENKQTNFLKQKRAEALFAEGFVEAACEENKMPAFGGEEGFIRAICADLIGVPPTSALAYEVYRESGRDTHPFFNAAGEILYRDLAPNLPEGSPSVWEAPIVAKIFGTEIFERPLSREVLLALSNNETVPHGIRMRAKNLSEQPLQNEKSDGHILDYLSAEAKLRSQMNKLMKPE